jgi:hypothetical protein
MNAHLRIARPVSILNRSTAMYKAALGFQEVGAFNDHDGFDGVMLALPGKDFHFEFTHCRTRPVKPAPTPEDLLVFYLPDAATAARTCEAMRESGFVEVAPFNPYWSQKGRTFEDPDGYRVVVQNASWPE